MITRMQLTREHGREQEQEQWVEGDNDKNKTLKEADKTD